MKNLFKLFGNLNRDRRSKVPLLIIALVAVIGFSMAACDTGDTGGGTQPPDPTSAVFESKDNNGNIYILEITKDSSRAAYQPITGDKYVLTIILVTGGTRINQGTVTVAGTTLTLSGGTSLTVTISNQEMKAMAGTITFTDSTPLTAPATLTPTPAAGSKTINLLANRWGKGEDEENWTGSMALSDVTAVKPKKGDIFTFKVSGTTDKTLEKFGLAIENHADDWNGYELLGGSESVKVSGNFSHTLAVEIWEEFTSGWDNINLAVYNDVPVPNEISNWATIATISNFEVRLVGVNMYAPNIAEMDKWLKAQPANTPATAHTYKLNVGNLGGNASNSGSVGAVLMANNNKYVKLDLSGSTITYINSNAFMNWDIEKSCETLVGITIPKSVTIALNDSSAKV